MPAPVRLGVLAGAGRSFSEWRDASGVPIEGVWQLINMESVVVCRRNNWYFSAVICLSDWRDIPNFDAVLEVAQGMIERAPSRRRRVIERPPALPEEFALPPSIPDPYVSGLNESQANVQANEAHAQVVCAPLDQTPPPWEGPSRAACISYLLGAGHDVPPSLEYASLDQLRQLRNLSIQMEAARLNYRNSNEQAYRQQYVALCNVVSSHVQVVRAARQYSEISRNRR